MKTDSRTWCLWCVEYDNYSGAGRVRDLYFEPGDPRIKRERGGVLVFTDKALGLSRVLYETKEQAENVLLQVMND